MVHTKQEYNNYIVVNYTPTGNFVRNNKGKEIEIYNFKSIRSVDEKTYVDFYADISKTLRSNHGVFVVEEIDHKLSLKVYYTERYRRVGTRYFATQKSVDYLTYNLKTKNLYYGNRKGSKKKVFQKKIRVNNFIDDPVLTVKSKTLNYFSELASGLMDQHRFVDMLFDKFIDVLYEKRGFKRNKDFSVSKSLYLFYLMDNGFKYPDSFYLFRFFKLKKYELKKEKNIVNLTMKKLNLRGKKIKKLLNQYENLSPDVIYTYRLLGLDYFNKVEESTLLKYMEGKNGPQDFYYMTNESKEYFNLLTKEERKRFLKIINQNVSIDIISDHVLMFKKIKDLGGDFKLKFNDKHDFSHEHFELTEELEKLRKGYVVRFNGEKFKERIEEVIYDFNGVEYYPVYLSNSDMYNDETKVQSNCVQTYADQKSSIIISLRLGSKDSKNRATIEYRIVENKVIRVQSLGRFNKTLESNYDLPMELLDNKIQRLYNQGILKRTEIEVLRNKVLDEKIFDGSFDW